VRRISGRVSENCPARAVFKFVLTEYEVRWFCLAVARTLGNVSAEMDEDGLTVDGVTVFKDGAQYMFGVLVTSGGSYWDPPDHDFVVLKDEEDEDEAYDRLDRACQAFVINIVKSRLGDLGEMIHYEREELEEKAEKVLNG